MIFYKYNLQKNVDGYVVILYIKPHSALEEFAEEFGLTTKTEEDINRVAVSFVKKKFPTLKVRAVKVMMGGVLVTTIMLGGNMSQTLAAEQEGQEETQNQSQTESQSGLTNESTVETTGQAELETATPGEAATNKVISAEDGAIPAGEEEVALEEPGLLPGDFFYFAKTLTEKIQLALTFDDVEKAKLLSQFANERIAEANALMEAGDTEGAIALLNQALESQELALDYTEEVLPDDQISQADDNIPIEVEPGDGSSSVDDREAGLDEGAKEVREDIETQFSKNLAALLMAMEKVENPKAKAALAKNVEKAYVRMEKRLGKMQQIEERLANAIPSPNNEDIEDLRKDIAGDQVEFEKEMANVVEESNQPTVTPPSKAGKESQEMNGRAEQKADYGQDKAIDVKETAKQKQAEESSTEPKTETEKVDHNQKSDKEKAEKVPNEKSNREADQNANADANKAITEKWNSDKNKKGNGKNNE